MHEPAKPAKPANPSGAPWRLGLALLVGVFLVGMTLSFVTAARRVSRVVDTDYYSHGLHYGETQDSSRNAGVGWSMAAALSGADLQVRVTDLSGAPVAGGMLSFEPQQNDPSRPADSLVWSEAAPGVFRAPHPASAGAELRGTLRFTRGSAVATQKLVFLN